MLQQEKTINSKKLHLLLLLILFFSCMFRISLLNQIYSESPSSIQRNDTVRYEGPALQLLKSGTLAISPSAPQTTTLSTTPVYSLLIAGVYKVSDKQDQYALIVIQILLSALTILMVYLLANKLWNQKNALIASLLTATDPLQILYSQILLSETLFIFFFIGSLLSTSYLILSPSKYTWALTLGLIITLATMTKPIGYYLVFCIVIGLAIFRSRVTQTWPQFLVVTLLILVPFLLTTSAWKLRNENLTGVYALNNAMSETMLYWKAKGVLMLSDSLTNEEAQEEIERRLPSGLTTPKAQADAETKLAKEIILNDLNNYFKLMVTGIKNIILGPGLTSQGMYYDQLNKGKYKENTTNKSRLFNELEKKTGCQFWYLSLLVYSTLLLLLVYPLATFGFYKAIRESTPDKVLVHLLMLGVVTYIILISTGHIAADSRMRLPIIPIFLLYASYGLYELIDIKRQKDHE